MCIHNDEEKVAKLRQQMTVLQLWKVIAKNDDIGIWADTCKPPNKFQIGENVADEYVLVDDDIIYPGAFHCTFTRKTARCYQKYRGIRALKIIKVFARTACIVSAGKDEYAGIVSVSVSEMEIKSLKHQR